MIFLDSLVSGCFEFPIFIVTGILVAKGDCRTNTALLVLWNLRNGEPTVSCIFQSFVVF